MRDQQDRCGADQLAELFGDQMFVMIIGRATDFQQRNVAQARPIERQRAGSCFPGDGDTAHEFQSNNAISVIP
jgi:hypothetical protein